VQSISVQLFITPFQNYHKILDKSMSYLTDVDIKRLLGRDIVIEPFSKVSLTPIGYDFTVGEFAFSLESGLIRPIDGYYRLPPKNTVQILTSESLWVSSRIAGTFHSKVSLVSKGLSHISTTLDPGWYGPLLITLRNNMENYFSLKIGDPFVTLIFSRVLTRTKSPHLRPAFRKDILFTQMKNQTSEYVDKISSLFGDTSILAKFEEKVIEANKPMFYKVLASVKAKVWRELINNSLIYIIYLGIFGLISLHMYWNKIKYLFNNIEYDSIIFTVQLTAIIALLSLVISLKKK